MLLLELLETLGDLEGDNTYILLIMRSRRRFKRQESTKKQE